MPAVGCNSRSVCITGRLLILAPQRRLMRHGCSGVKHFRGLKLALLHGSYTGILEPQQHVYSKLLGYSIPERKRSPRDR